MKEEMNELIVVEQLPIIKTKLEQLKVEIQEKVDNAMALVVNEDSIKDVKKTRAELNKEFSELEEQRKSVKQAIMSKYDEFEEIYKGNVSNLYKKADQDLKTKIDNVENQLKIEKENMLKEFFESHQQDKHIEEYSDFVSIGLNITLSATMKSLETQIIEYCESIEKDLKLIELEEFKDEILVEYKNLKDYPQAKINVYNRHKQLEEIKQKEIERQQIIEQEQKVIEQVEEIAAPVELEEEKQIFEVSFTVKGTKEQLKELKQFMIERNIKYV